MTKGQLYVAYTILPRTNLKTMLYILSLTDRQVLIAKEEQNLNYMVRKLEVEYNRNGMETSTKRNT